MEVLMRINRNYVLQEVVDEYIVVPVGEAAIHLQGIIRLNTTGAFLWNLLCDNSYSVQELAEIIATEFIVDKGAAEEDICRFITQLGNLGCLEQ